MATQNTSKAKADINKAAAAEGLPEDFANWTELQIGFAPYWAPAEGKKFFGEIINRDDRDPDFTRYLIRSHRPEDCRRGPKLTGEEVKIRKGDNFSIGVFAALRDEFDYHLFFTEKTGKHVPVVVEAVKKIPMQKKTDEGEDMTVWTWRALCSPEMKKELDKYRDEWRRINAKDSSERAPLES